MSSLSITTPRLHLRTPGPEDAASMNAYIRMPEIYRNLGRVAPEASLSQTQDFIARARSGIGAGTDYVCAITAQDQIVGTIGAHLRADMNVFDFGYWLAPQVWGRGLASEAAAALVAWLQANLGLRVLTAGHYVDNPASGRVLQKVGFIACGRTMYNSPGRGEYVDHREMIWIAPSAA